MTQIEFIINAPQIIIDLLDEIYTEHPTERKDYHPEPKVSFHIEMVTLRGLQSGNMNLACSGLLHDIMKYKTMRINKKTGYPTSPGHGKAASYLIDRESSIKDWIRSVGADVKTVKGIVGEHMRIKQFDKMRKHKQNIMRELPFYDLLCEFTKMDSMVNVWEHENSTETLKEYMIGDTVRLLPSIHDVWYDLK